MTANTKHFVPVGEKILVRADEPESELPSGIVLPEQSRASANRGVVVAVGNGRLLQNGERTPASVTEGDHVVFQKFAGIEVEIDDETFLAMTEDDLIAVVY